MKRALLKQAVDALGEQEVAKGLGCPVMHIKGWLAAAAPIPDATFLRLVDLVDKNQR